MQSPQINNYNTKVNSNNNYNQQSQSVSASYGTTNPRVPIGPERNTYYQAPSNNNVRYESYNSNAYSNVTTSSAQPVTARTGQTIAVPVSTPISFTEPTMVPVPGVTEASNATTATTVQTPTMTPALERCGIFNSNSDFFTNLQGVNRASRFSSRFGGEGNMTKFGGSSG